MEPKGMLDDGDVKMPYYGLRYNHNLGYMSNHPLGLQALISSMGSQVWINIKQSWIPKDVCLIDEVTYYRKGD